MVKDPVCGMGVSKEVARYGTTMATYKRKTYYFCARPCMESFLREPEKYMAKKPGA